MAPDTRRSKAALPPAVHRSALLGELESDDRQESAVGATQHGHGIETMLRVYAAWAEGAVEADIAAIRRAMSARPTKLRQATLAVDLAVESP
jgi:hypothetical protein